MVFACAPMRVRAASAEGRGWLLDGRRCSVVLRRRVCAVASKTERRQQSKIKERLRVVNLGFLLVHARTRETHVFVRPAFGLFV